MGFTSAEWLGQIAPKASVWAAFDKPNGQAKPAVLPARGRSLVLPAKTAYTHVVILATRKLGLFAAFAVLLAAPVMACLVPAEEMTAAERGCCSEAAGDCGAMPGMQLHSCCARTANPALFNIAAVAARASLNRSNTHDQVALPQGSGLSGATAPAVLSSFETHSPPLLEPPRFTTVLRI